MGRGDADDAWTCLEGEIYVVFRFYNVVDVGIESRSDGAAKDGDNEVEDARKNLQFESLLDGFSVGLEQEEKEGGN